MAELDEVADDLYARPPAEFIAARDAAVKAARTSGDKELAKRVAALRRPTVSAWLVNLLVRADPDLPEQLMSLGEGLRAAERSLDGPALRELSSQRRALVRSLVGEARRLARPAGQRISDAAVQELDATLTAALADAATARDVVSGRLTSPRAFVGFGSAVPDGAVPDGSAPDGSAPDGAVPDGSAPDGSAPDGAAPDGAAPPRLRLVRPDESPKPSSGTARGPGRGKQRADAEGGSPRDGGRPITADDATPQSAADAAAAERRARREARERRAREEAQAAFETAERAATEVGERRAEATRVRDDSAADLERTEAAAEAAHTAEDDLVRELAETRRRLVAAGKASAAADRDADAARQALRRDEREVAAVDRELRRAERARDAAAAARDALPGG
ncbi:hypothetical protein IC607_09820 [Cellulomonas sp. JH27-2]|uniref:hypothetical protein n=1 Tax=Cellulomonas sp. JH27-2 TaxID=2774139 RepID=UPI0017804E95|nr:hypothetical protein [Cellulomonas sp. JH27-2]MBD8059265.1 hypothetical protein [Cellulomonas sp. JH27-2]